MTVLADLNTAVSALETYAASAVALVDPTVSGDPDLTEQQVLTRAAREAEAALAILKADDERLKNRLTHLGL